MTQGIGEKGSEERTIQNMCIIRVGIRVFESYCSSTISCSICARVVFVGE